MAGGVWSVIDSSADIIESGVESKGSVVSVGDVETFVTADVGCCLSVKKISLDLF